MSEPTPSPTVQAILGDASILTPRLVIDGADAAIDVYGRVFEARCVERYDTKAGHVVHAALSIRGAILSVIDAAVAGIHSTASDASRILLHLEVQDPDATATALVAAGGEIVIPIENQFYGAREGRVRDPFGHLWILSRKIEDVDADELARRVQAWEG